jgi:hypothetical protein
MSTANGSDSKAEPNITMVAGGNRKTVGSATKNAMV